MATQTTMPSDPLKFHFTTEGASLASASQRRKPTVAATQTHMPHWAAVGIGCSYLDHVEHDARPCRTGLPPTIPEGRPDGDEPSRVMPGDSSGVAEACFPTMATGTEVCREMFARPGRTGGDVMSTAACRLPARAYLATELVDKCSHSTREVRRFGGVCRVPSETIEGSELVVQTFGSSRGASGHGRRDALRFPTRRDRSSVQTGRWATRARPGP